MYSEAFIPQLISKTEKKILIDALSIIGGVLLISVLAQVAIPLPWTPVPITGQTFAVAFVSLLWGAKRSGMIMSLYLGLGAAGVPVFAMGGAGLVVGPTLGYLVGMWLASLIVGTLADRGFADSFGKALVAAYMGSAMIFSCGVIGLSFFMPSEALLVGGVLPFLAGDFIKNILAASLATKATTCISK